MSYLKLATSNLSNWKISRKSKNSYIWDQKYLIWVFLGSHLKIVLLYLKSAHSSLSNSKISWKMKMLIFGIKNALFGYFWTGILKRYCYIVILEISTLQICQKRVLTFYSEFWYRVRFFWRSKVRFFGRSRSGSWSAL